MICVIDASVAAKWFFAEPYAAAARRLIDPAIQLLAPDLISVEICNLAWRKLRTGEASAQQVNEIVREFPRLLARVSATTPLLRSAFDIAVALDHPAYDCFYLALAAAMDCELVTADLRFASVVRGTAWHERLRLLDSD